MKILTLQVPVIEEKVLGEPPKLLMVSLINSTCKDIIIVIFNGM